MLLARPMYVFAFARGGSFYRRPNGGDAKSMVRAHAAAGCVCLQTQPVFPRTSCGIRNVAMQCRQQFYANARAHITQRKPYFHPTYTKYMEVHPDCSTWCEVVGESYGGEGGAYIVVLTCWKSVASLTA